MLVTGSCDGYLVANPLNVIKDLLGTSDYKDISALFRAFSDIFCFFLKNPPSRTLKCRFLTTSESVVKTAI